MFSIALSLAQRDFHVIILNRNKHFMRSEALSNVLLVLGRFVGLLRQQFVYCTRLKYSLHEPLFYLKICGLSFPSMISVLCAVLPPLAPTWNAINGQGLICKNPSM